MPLSIEWVFLKDRVLYKYWWLLFRPGASPLLHLVVVVVADVVLPVVVRVLVWVFRLLVAAVDLAVVVAVGVLNAWCPEFCLLVLVVGSAVRACHAVVVVVFPLPDDLNCLIRCQPAVAVWAYPAAVAVVQFSVFVAKELVFRARVVVPAVVVPTLPAFHPFPSG